MWNLTLSGCQMLEKKRAEQQYLQEEVMRINAETMRAKQQRREEEKLADMRDMEYIRKKMVRWKANYLLTKKSFWIHTLNSLIKYYFFSTDIS